MNTINNEIYNILKQSNNNCIKTSSIENEYSKILEYNTDP